MSGGRLIDVGSGSSGVAPWLGARWSVVAVDESFTDYGALSGEVPQGTAEIVRADARALPFGDDEFDVGVALDMLEHVPAKDRACVISELGRVTRDRIIVGCPSGSAAEDADRDLLAWCQRRGLSGEGWLAEHVENGFPTEDELLEWLGPIGEVRLIGNESAATHAMLMRFEIRRPGRAISKSVSRILAPMLGEGARGRRATATLTRIALRGCDRQPTYRTIAIVDCG